jgi:hypothetical protein
LKRKIRSLVTGTLLILLLPVLLSSALLGSVSASSSDLTILEGDTLLIQITPVVDEIAINYTSQSSKMVSVQFTINGTGSTYIWIRPESGGLLSLTIFFRTNATWSKTRGVITDKPSFYGGYTDVQPYSGTYSLVTFDSDSELQAGNFTVTYNLTVWARSPSLFSFELPESINAVFFVAVVASLGYVNVFFLLDLHFKNKTEGVSRRRMILVGLLIAASVFISYEMYVFTTFTGT